MPGCNPSTSLASGQRTKRCRHPAAERDPPNTGIQQNQQPALTNCDPTPRPPRSGSRHLASRYSLAPRLPRFALQHRSVKATTRPTVKQSKYILQFNSDRQTITYIIVYFVPQTTISYHRCRCSCTILVDRDANVGVDQFTGLEFSLLTSQVIRFRQE